MAELRLTSSHRSSYTERITISWTQWLGAMLLWPEGRCPRVGTLSGALKDNLRSLYWDPNFSNPMGFKTSGPSGLSWLGAILGLVWNRGIGSTTKYKLLLYQQLWNASSCPKITILHITLLWARFALQHLWANRSAWAAWATSLISPPWWLYSLSPLNYKTKAGTSVTRPKLEPASILNELVLEAAIA